jgi:hypothetical protein
MRGKNWSSTRYTTIPFGHEELAIELLGSRRVTVVVRPHYLPRISPALSQVHTRREWTKDELRSISVELSEKGIEERIEERDAEMTTLMIEHGV